MRGIKSQAINGCYISAQMRQKNVLNHVENIFSIGHEAGFSWPENRVH